MYGSLGYEKAARYIKPLTDSSLNMPLRVDFVLKETTYQINEVIKYGDKPIVVNRNLQFKIVCNWERKGG